MTAQTKESDFDAFKRFAQYSRQTDVENYIEDEEIPETFYQIAEQIKEKRQQKENIIPPVGIAKPELVESFERNIGDEEKILKDIEEAESYERETGTETGIRQIASHAARAAEGFFGGIGSFLNLLTPELYESEEGIPLGPGERPEGFPSPERLHEITKEKTGKYLEPKSKQDITSQEIASDIGSMFSTPGLGWLQKVLLPVGGQATKQLMKSSGAKESSQDLGKLGFMSLATISNLGNAPRIARNAMQQAREMIPRGLSFNAQPIERALQNIRRSNWFITGSTPSKAPALREIERIEAQINNGRINGQTAMQLRVDINEARRQLGAFQLNPVADRAAARRYLDEVDRALLEGMENYGRNVNPQWWRNYQQANQAFAVTQRSRVISDFIQQNAKPLNSEMAKTLFHMGAGAGIVKLPALAAAAIPVAATAKSIQIMNRMVRSPVLRNHYLDVLRATATGNAAMMNKALEKFDKEALKHEYPKD